METLTALIDCLELPLDYTIYHDTPFVSPERKDHLAKIGESNGATLEDCFYNVKDYAEEKELYSPQHLAKIKSALRSY